MHITLNLVFDKSSVVYDSFCIMFLMLNRTTSVGVSGSHMCEGTLGVCYQPVTPKELYLDSLNRGYSIN